MWCSTARCYANRRLGEALVIVDSSEARWVLLRMRTSTALIRNGPGIDWQSEWYRSVRLRIESFLAWGGVLVQGGTLASHFAGIVTDPLYVVASTLVGMLLSLWFAVACWTDTATTSSKTVGADGLLHESQVFKKPLRIRILSIILVSLTCSAFLATLAIERAGIFALVDIHALEYQATAHLMGEGPQAEYASLPLSPYYDVAELNSYTAESLLVGSAGCRFNVIKHPSRPWVQIDGVRVIVEEFKPFPRHMKPVFATRMPVAAYVVQLDNPTECGRDSFPAKLLAVPKERNDTLWELGGIVLHDDLPHPFIVKILARRRGIYTYRIELNVSCNWQRQTVIICRGQQCACEGRDSDWIDKGPLPQPQPGPSPPAAAPAPTVPSPPVPMPTAPTPAVVEPTAPAPESNVPTDGPRDVRSINQR